MYKRTRADSGFKLVMLPEQKNNAWINDFVQIFTEPGHLVVDACAGADSVAKAGGLLYKHRSSVGCEVYPNCLSMTIPQLILPYSRKVRRKELDNNGEEKLCSSAEMYIEEL